MLDARVDVVQSFGAPIVRVTVPNGLEKPYALTQTRVYVRQEGETNEAVRDELVRLVLAGQQAGEPVEAEPIPAPTVVAEPAPVVVAKPEPVRVAEPVVLPVEPTHPALTIPSIGVEIVSVEERKGTRYFGIRDLRNGSVVQNVTPGSARKLWSYAITQHLTNPADPAAVLWRGEYGLWKAERRAKKVRYDLALRQPDAPGALRVFYGVTEDGMVGPWASFLRPDGQAGAGIPVVEESGTAPAAEVAPQPVAAPTATEPKRRAPARRTPKAEAAPQPVVEVAKPSETVVAPAPITSLEAPVPAEAKPQARSRGRRGAAKADTAAAAPVPVEVAPTAPAPAEAKPPARPRGHRGGAAAEAVAQAPALTEAKPQARSRGRRGGAPVAAAVEAVAVPPAPPAPSQPVAAVEMQPEPKKPRSRSRKAQPAAEATG